MGSAESQQAEFTRCALDPEYFIRQHVRIVVPGEGVQRFNLWPFQRAVLRAYVRESKLISLKPRQMGLTTLTAAYTLWTCLFTSHTNALAVSITERLAKRFLDRVKFMYKLLPRYLQIPIVTDSATVLEFANGSLLQASAATEYAGRSESLSLLVLDEVAFQPKAHTIWSAAQPTLTNHSKAILISTPNGIGNMYHSTWNNALNNENGFFPVQLRWDMRPDRDNGWYQLQSRLLIPRLFRQEVDCEFVGSADNVFDYAVLRELEQDVADNPPLSSTRVGSGTLHVYRKFQAGKRYFIGADVSTGRARDNSAFSVMDTSGIEYASYSGKIPPNQFAELMVKTGRKYGNAIIAPERNGVGEAVLAALEKLGYRNLYYPLEPYRRKGQISRKQSPIPGWVTTNSTRQKILATLMEDLHEGQITTYDPVFVQEAKAFIYDRSGKPVAMGKTVEASGYEAEGVVYTDDAIIAKAITNSIRQDTKRGLGITVNVG